MPIYEYACESCGERFDKLMSMNDPTPPCPACGAVQVRKLVSAASFVLKGSGWYKDGYGLKSGSNAKKSEGASDGKGEGKSEGKGDGGSSGEKASTKQSSAA
jgi:putative FmdB family regulatory protein